LVAEAATFDRAVPRTASRAPLRRPNRWVYGGLAAAAALLLITVLPLSRPGPSPPPGPTVATTPPDDSRSPVRAAPVPLEPTGILAVPPRAFRWRAMAGASRYRVELSNGSGELVWRSEEHTSELQSLRHLVC